MRFSRNKVKGQAIPPRVRVSTHTCAKRVALLLSQRTTRHLSVRFSFPLELPSVLDHFADISACNKPRFSSRYRVVAERIAPP
jgi:ferritin-like protein